MLLQNDNLGVINRIRACKPRKIFLLLCVDNAFYQNTAPKSSKSFGENLEKMSKNHYFCGEKKKREVDLDSLEKRLFMGDIVKDFK